MAKITTKLKAGTLLESTIAMVLIIVCFGIGTMVITNVLSNDHSHNAYRAKNILNDISFKIQTTKKYIDENELVQGFKIQKTFEKYLGADNILQMTLRAVDNNEKIIYEHHELIIIE
jgi:hypothetical protein